MSQMTNAINKGIIQQYQDVASHSVLNAIEKASHKTGVDFAYLVDQAQAESSFNPSAKAKTSSASGLYQFIDQTWLSMIKKHGENYGLEKWADKISIQNGRATVSDPSAKKAILNLRNNPEIASQMAAELAKQNEQYLTHHVRGLDEASSTDLYLAHFMGANGAARFINAMNTNPDQNAATLFKKEARANHAVFYDAQTNEPRNLKDVYAFFEKKFTPQPLEQKPTHAPFTQIASIDTNDIAHSTNQAQALEAISLMYKNTQENQGYMAQLKNMGYLSPLTSESLFMIQEILSDLDQKTAFL